MPSARPLRRVTVFAPATIANLGPGFDALGLAIHKLGDTVTAERVAKPGVTLVVRGRRSGLPTKPTDNVAAHVARLVLDACAPDLGVKLTLQKGMPIGSGLGSSAASCVAAAVAVNALLPRPLPRAELIRFCAEGERKASGTAHADNVGAALLGGACLVRGGNPPDVWPLTVQDVFTWIVAHPHVVVRTADARKILPRTVPLAIATRQWANVAGLVSALASGDATLLGRSIDDGVVEPARAPLIPCFYGVKEAALAAGALGCSIAGSGPSMFAAVRSDGPVRRVAAAMRDTFRREARVGCDLTVSRVNREGARIVRSAVR